MPMMPMIFDILSIKVSEFDQQKVVRLSKTSSRFISQTKGSNLCLQHHISLLVRIRVCIVVIFNGIQNYALKFHEQLNRIWETELPSINLSLMKIMEGNKAFDVYKMETSVFIISIVFPDAVPLILQLTANTPQSIKAFKFSYDAILLKMKINDLFEF